MKPFAFLWAFGLDHKGGCLDLKDFGFWRFWILEWESNRVYGVGVGFGFGVLGLWEARMVGRSIWERF